MRIPSFMVACRVFSSPTLIILISSCLVDAAVISARSFCIDSGFFTNRYMIPHSAVASLSLPPMMKRLAFDSISSTLMPFSSLCRRIYVQKSDRCRCSPAARHLWTFSALRLICCIRALTSFSGKGAIMKVIKGLNSLATPNSKSALMKGNSSPIQGRYTPFDKHLNGSPNAKSPTISNVVYYSQFLILISVVEFAASALVS